MTIDWEDRLRQWSKPASDTEQERMDNAERVIREALKASAALQHHSIRVFPQGSYRNNTNVRQDSDVDICVMCTDTVFTDFSQASGLTKEACGYVSSPYSFYQFKDDVHAALVQRFGKSAVTRGDKAIDVHANSYRVDADVVACFEHQLILPTLDHNLRPRYLSGTQFYTDSGKTIVNWPEQHYSNGTKKNTETGNRYKYITRVLKRLKYHLKDSGNLLAAQIPSFLLECLAWNVPNSYYGDDRYILDTVRVLKYIEDHAEIHQSTAPWTEVSGRKYLFADGQPWTLRNAVDFARTGLRFFGL